MAIAARQLQQKGKLGKILIVDWVSSPAPPGAFASPPRSALELDWGAANPPLGWDPPGVRMGEQEQILERATLEQGRDPAAFSSLRLLNHPEDCKTAFS